MEITIEQLKHMLDRLPDPNNYHRGHYCVVLPPKIDVIMNRSFAPDPRSIASNELYLTRVPCHNRGYTWSVNLKSETEILRETEIQISYYKQNADELRQIAHELKEDLRYTNMKYTHLLNRKYVKFFINLRIWKTYLAMKFRKQSR